MTKSFGGFYGQEPLRSFFEKYGGQGFAAVKTGNMSWRVA
jgi:hypothetical protein